MMHVTIHKFGQVSEEKFSYVVICAKYDGKWLLVRHRDREIWEMAGGHIEEGESAYAAALRELYEETGISGEEIYPVCDYEVSVSDSSTYGRLFYIEANRIGRLPEYEIGEVRLFENFPESCSCTYPQIQPRLIDQIVLFEQSTFLSGAVSQTLNRKIQKME